MGNVCLCLGAKSFCQFNWLKVCHFAQLGALFETVQFDRFVILEKTEASICKSSFWVFGRFVSKLEDLTTAGRLSLSL